MKIKIDINWREELLGLASLLASKTNRKVGTLAHKLEEGGMLFERIEKGHNLTMDKYIKIRLFLDEHLNEIGDQ